MNPKTTDRKSSLPHRSEDDPLDLFLNETVALFHRLKAAAEEIHGDGELSAGRRGVLRDLTDGPKTVPEMARARPVSRQYIQSLVNALADEDLVEFAPNPAHKRSHLVQLTDKGNRYVEAMNAREEAVLSRIDLPVSHQELRTAADVLRRVRSVLESTAWQEAVKKAGRKEE